MSKKRHAILVGLASMTLFAGFMSYADYYDQVKNNIVESFSTETPFPAPQNTPLFSQASPDNATETPPLREQSQAVTQAGPAPGQPALQPAQSETASPANLPSTQAAPQPAEAQGTPANNTPQVNPPAQDPITPAPAPVKNKTTTTRAS